MSKKQFPPVPHRGAGAHINKHTFADDVHQHLSVISKYRSAPAEASIFHQPLSLSSSAFFPANTLSRRAKRRRLVVFMLSAFLLICHYETSNGIIIYLRSQAGGWMRCLLILFLLALALMSAHTWSFALACTRRSLAQLTICNPHGP